MIRASSILFLITISASLVPVHSAYVGANVEVTAFNDLHDRQQVEPSIAVDPRNPNIVVAAAQDYRLVAEGKHRWHGYYRSTDNGRTWSVSLLPGFPGDTSPEGQASPLQAFNATSDPVVAFDRSGTLYYTGIAFTITPQEETLNLRVFVARYINDGRDYDGVTVLDAIDDADKPWIAVDTSGGPWDGTVYLALDGILLGQPFTSVFTRSADGGRTFSTPVRVPSAVVGFLPGITVDDVGTVYISTVSGLNATHSRIRVSRSTNQGGTFTTVTAVASFPDLPSPLPGNNFRTFSIPQIAADGNGVYLVWDDFRTGDADVLFSRSTDGGMTWTSPLRINDASTNHQFFPTITVFADVISIAWYDSRLDDGGTIEKLDVYYAESVNGGSSFSISFRVTTVSFDPNIVKRTDPPGTDQPFIGDYIHASAGITGVRVIWADNRNACGEVDPVFGCVDQDAYVATIIPRSTPQIGGGGGGGRPRPL